MSYMDTSIAYQELLLSITYFTNVCSNIGSPCSKSKLQTLLIGSSKRNYSSGSSVALVLKVVVVAVAITALAAEKV